MDQQRAKLILRKYQQGLCTPHEVALLHRWYEDQGKRLDSFPDFADPLKEEKLIWNRIEIGIAEPVEKLSNQSKHRLDISKRFKTTSKQWIPYAAAVLIFALAASVYFYYDQFLGNKGSVIDSNLLAHDIDPGGNRASLTFADGRRIDLSDDQSGIIMSDDIINYNDGSSISIASFRSEGSEGEGSVHMVGTTLEKAQTLVLSTPKGGQYQVTLSDGTKVWLNAASTLKYPNRFVGKNRRIELDGEAYFEVSKDPKMPFIVTSISQDIEVLGTEFNVSAYSDDPAIKTTLVEGSVKVSNKVGMTVNLKPNQQSIQDRDGIKVVPIPASEAIAWKNGEFSFYEEPLESIMRKLERWYQIETLYVDESLKKQAFVGVINRFSSISKVLSKLEATGNAQFRIDGNQIIISRKK